MRILDVDIETYSSADLQKSGAYAYAAAPDFEVLLIGYAFDGEPVRLVDLTQEPMPAELAEALQDPGTIKVAHNANFERACLARHFDRPMPPEQWRCTAVHASMLGLPRSLDGVARALHLTTQKMAAGKSLIRYFCVPCKPTKRNGGRTRNLPVHDPEKWELFKTYCAQDVETERAVRIALGKYPIPDTELRLWELDQRINDRGIRVDKTLVERAIACDTAYRDRMIAEAVDLTGLENPNSVAQLKTWLQDAEGLEVESLNKETVPELIKQAGETGKRVLEIRQDIAKASCKKYEAIMNMTGRYEDRVRGILQFYGAGRTGRWAGRGVQVHNLPQNHIPDLDLAHEMLHGGRFEELEMFYDSVPATLSQLVRTAFIPSTGCRFIVADFSAIEARVLSWLAGEKWRMDVFRTHGKIYEASAAQMFRVPIETVTKGSSLRQKGKVSELALGYQGAAGALIQMGALKMGLTEEELPELVNAWRKANPHIVRFWGDVEDAALRALYDRTTVKLQYGLAFSCAPGFLFLRLPSGRRLAYVKPRLMPGRFGRDQITYEGVEGGKWKRIPTYGGKLTENIVQAIARDCLALAMLRLDKAGYTIAMHVHDEVVLDMPVGAGSLEEACGIMGRPIPWAPGLPLRADGFECDFYKKD